MAENRIFKKIVSSLFGNISGKKIVILGFAFKANTNDTRESPSIQISRYLIEENAKLVFNDPKVTLEKIKEDLFADNDLENKEINHQISFEEDLYKASIDADALIILTEWDKYKNINWNEIENNMRNPAWVFDTRGIIVKSQISKTKINFWQLGGE